MGRRNSKSQMRYERRQYKRKLKQAERNKAIGSMEDLFNFRDLYYYGLKSCNLVRWKGSVQNHEMHLVSKTARMQKDVLEGKWEPDRYIHFIIHERGKVRPIDAPRIRDRQMQKLYTKEVLLELYLPSMIYNNGASLPGKGFDFSMKLLEKELHEHYRKWGRAGSVILIDFSKFFPNADHDEIKRRHERLIFDPKIRALADQIVDSSPEEIGLPLGIETSQAEMIAYPSELDNYIKCQLGLKGAGHYMDDYCILVPPTLDAKEVLELIIAKATSLKLIINRNKTQIKPLTSTFTWCKTRYTLTETGAVIKRGNPKNLKRDRHKFLAFPNFLIDEHMGWLEVWTSVNGMIAYFKKYDDHNRILKLNRLFFNLFGFYPETIEPFRERSELWSTLPISDLREKLLVEMSTSLPSLDSVQKMALFTSMVNQYAQSTATSALPTSPLTTTEMVCIGAA